VATRPPNLRPPGSLTREQRAVVYDVRRREEKPWRRWYSLAIWLQRRTVQLAAEPLCCMCRAAGVVRVATVADHVEPHRGDWNRFVNGLLQSLCDHHHSSAKQREEHAASAKG